MVWLFVVALWAVLLLAPVLLLFFFLPSGRDCPRCGSETLLIHSRLLRPVRRLAKLRWCTSCKWEGIMRPASLRRPLPKLEVVPDDRDEDNAPWRGGQDK